MRIMVWFMAASPGQDALHAAAERKTVTQGHQLGFDLRTNSGQCSRRLAFLPGLDCSFHNAPMGGERLLA
jgi:hypothetical protein